MKKNKNTQKKDEVLEKFYAQNKTHPAYLSLAKIRNMLSFLGYDGKSVGRFEKDFELIEKILKAVDEIEAKTGIKITELPNTIDLERIVENYRKADTLDKVCQVMKSNDGMNDSDILNKINDVLKGVLL